MKRRWSEREREKGHKKYLKRIYKILDENLSKADTFVLIAPFDRRRDDCNIVSNFFKIKHYHEETYDSKFPYGKYKLKKADGIRALERAEEYYKNRLRGIYMEQSGLPSFDVLYSYIKSECLEHEKKRKLGTLNGESPYISDLVYDGKVKYTEPYNIVWHFYDTLGRLFCGDDNCAEIVEMLAHNRLKRPYDYELHRGVFRELLPYLISVTPTFVWHKDNSWELHKEFRFRYNEQTKKWFLVNRNRFSLRLNQLKSFALYCGNELVFADERWHPKRMF